MDLNGQTEIKDFSRPLAPHPFRVNDDIFAVIPQIPLGLVADVMKAVKGARTEDGQPDLEGMLGIYDILLVDECVPRWRERMNSKTEPIGHEQLLEVTNWALEKYGLRPTQPSETSSTGSDVAETSTASTDGPAPTDVPDGSTGQPGEVSTSSTPTSEN